MSSTAIATTRGDPVTTRLGRSWYSARWTLWVAFHNTFALSLIVYVLLQSRAWSLRRGAVQSDGHPTPARPEELVVATT